MRVDKKGAIDLVTEVDLEVERASRALLGARFPDHDILAEELGGGALGRSHRWVFDPLDGTTNFAHGVPIFCSSLALEIDGEAVVGAVFDPNRQELFTAERGVGAWLNGAPLRTSTTATSHRRAAGHGFPLRRAQHARRGDRPVFRVRVRGPRDSPAGLGRPRSLLGGGRTHGRVLGRAAAAVGHARRRVARAGGRRPRHGPRRRPVGSRGRSHAGVERPPARRRWSGSCRPSAIVAETGRPDLTAAQRRRTRSARFQP